MQKFRALAVLTLAYAAVSAQASLTYYKGIWQGSYYGNSASAIGIIGIDLSLLTSTGVDFHPISPTGSIQSIDMTVQGSLTPAYNGHFVTSDYEAYSTEFSLPIDPSVQWIGQDQGNGERYGDDSFHNDFNLVAKTSSFAPTASLFFQLSTGGHRANYERMRLVWFAPAAVPEPASMAALGLGALGLLRRRKRA